jgi:TFIIF-interacting CTD phosphatase-like protein
MGAFPIIPLANKIPFEFKKHGFKKLLIFDLDETLIHSLRDNEGEDDDFNYRYDD